MCYTTVPECTAEREGGNGALPSARNGRETGDREPTQRELRHAYCHCCSTSGSPPCDAVFPVHCSDGPDSGGPVARFSLQALTVT